MISEHDEDGFVPVGVGGMDDGEREDEILLCKGLGTSLMSLFLRCE